MFSFVYWGNISVFHNKYGTLLLLNSLYLTRQGLISSALEDFFGMANFPDLSDNGLYFIWPRLK